MLEITEDMKKKIINEMLGEYKPRDPQRIPVVLAEIQKIWEQNPDLRLGQLLMNCCSNGEVLYNLEEDILLNRMKEVYK